MFQWNYVVLYFPTSAILLDCKLYTNTSPNLFDA